MSNAHAVRALSMVLVLGLVPLMSSSEVLCTEPPCAASLTENVATTTVAGVGADNTQFVVGENVWGPFETGFGVDQATELESLCGNSDVETDSLYIQGGIDVYTAEQMIAETCSVELPRTTDDEYFGLLDECGARTTTNQHFHASLSCLYSDAATGHSPEVAEVNAEVDGVKQKLYGKWEDYNPDSSTYILPALDACNGHFGITPDSAGATVYHYHVTDLPPFTVGCFGPAKAADDTDILVSPTTCRGLYTGTDGCGGGDTVRITTPTGSRNYDPWCPCWSGMSNVEGGESPSLPPNPPSPAPVAPSPTPSPEDTTETVHTITFNAGWTWVSSPLFDGSTTLFGDMNGLAGNNDQLKGQLSFTSYIAGYGWFGQLSEVEPDACYRVRLSNGGDVSFTGTPADVTGRKITLNAGWTWLGWPSMTASSVSVFADALTSPELLNSQDDRIKSQYLFTSYIPSYGWFGDLTQFEPGFGYMVKLVNANELTSFGATIARRELETVRFESRPARVVGTGPWQLTPAAFEYSMCVVAVVVVDGAVAEDGDLAAFVDGQLRGVARPSSYTAPVGAYKGYKSYNLMAYGQTNAEGATVTFQYRHADGRVSMLTPTTSFSKDAFLGSVAEPHVIEHATPSATPSPSPSPSRTAVPAIDATDSATVQRLDIRLVAAVAAAGTLVLILVGLCVWRVSAGRLTKQGDLTAEVVLPHKVDADTASVSAA